MKRLTLMCAAFLAAAPLLAAQQPADSAGAARRSARRAQFQEQREARLVQALGLTADQASKLKATEERFRSQREPLLKARRDLTVALRAQLKPGVAANTDSVRKLLDAREQNGTRLADLRRSQSREMASYLTPVQRAQLELRQERWRGRLAHHKQHRGRDGRNGQGNEWRQRGQDNENG